MRFGVDLANERAKTRLDGSPTSQSRWCAVFARARLSLVHCTWMSAKDTSARRPGHGWKGRNEGRDGVSSLEAESERGWWLVLESGREDVRSFVCSLVRSVPSGRRRGLSQPDPETYRRRGKSAAAATDAATVVKNSLQLAFRGVCVCVAVTA